MQCRVRAKWGKILSEWRYCLGIYATKGGTLISRVEYEFRSSVGTLEDCVGI